MLAAAAGIVAVAVVEARLRAVPVRHPLGIARAFACMRIRPRRAGLAIVRKDSRELLEFAWAEEKGVCRYGPDGPYEEAKENEGSPVCEVPVDIPWPGEGRVEGIRVPRQNARQPERSRVYVVLVHPIKPCQKDLSSSTPRQRQLAFFVFVVFVVKTRPSKAADFGFDVTLSIHNGG